MARRICASSASSIRSLNVMSCLMPREGQAGDCSSSHARHSSGRRRASTVLHQAVLLGLESAIAHEGWSWHLKAAQSLKECP
jgi:hypothetical protein